MPRLHLAALSLIVAVFAVKPCAAFVTNGRWTSTATNGSTPAPGGPVTVTWSFAANGTTIPGFGSNNLIPFFDNLFGAGVGGGDLTQRPWFAAVSGSFARWGELGGISFVYEPADDGKTLGSFAGELHVRGDIRIGGVNIDGPGGINGQTAFLNNGDITLDTGDPNYFDDSPPADMLPMRNTLMHEIGHALGLGHSDSNTAAFLMEPNANNAFEGPQFDDIRGVQQLYGDALEKGAGNGDATTATSLGPISPGELLIVGGDGNTGVEVSTSEHEFVSISNLGDVDCYSFTIDKPAFVNVAATPVGPNYSERMGVNYPITRSSRASDLQLSLFRDVEGSPVLLTTTNAAPLGQTESLGNFPLVEAGQYFIRIAGDTDVVQTYQLSVGAVASSPGDFDLNETVDGRDFLAWQRGFGPVFDGDDLDQWAGGFGAATAASISAPEPAALALAGFWGLVLLRARRG